MGVIRGTFQSASTNLTDDAVGLTKVLDGRVHLSHTDHIGDSGFGGDQTAKNQLRP
jgi:hypothetical protein